MLKKGIDYKILEKTLQDALCEAELYKLQNDAKFRAIEQNVPTYDNFKEMVNAAHLRPLENADKRNKSKVSWNRTMQFNFDYKNYSENFDNSASKPKEDEVHSMEDPETSEEFFRICSNLSDPAEKMHYLFRMRNTLKDKFFRAEVPSSFISDFIKLYRETSKHENAVVVELLEILSECSRFRLNMTFISKEERKSCERMFQKLFDDELIEVKKDVIELLAVKYQVSIDTK